MPAHEFSFGRPAPRSIARGEQATFNPVRLFAHYLRICALALLLHGAAQASPGQVEVEMSGAHDSNPSRSPAGNGNASEEVYGASASLLRTHLLDEYSGLLFRGGASIFAHTTFSGLNQLALNATLRYRWQPKVGYTLPWYEILLALERNNFADSAIRNATSAALELSVGKNFTDRTYVTGGLGLKRSVADREYIFDQTQSKLFIAASYRFPQQETLYARLSRLHGDQVFGADEYYGVRGSVKASGSDPVFGEDFDAYRMAATTTVAEIGVNLPVRGHGAWDFSARRSHAYADTGLAYDYSLMLVSWSYRF